MNTLCLHTAQFPYGVGEQFIETEIQYLVQEFDRVVIIPQNSKGQKRSLPDGVEVMLPFYEKYSTIKGIANLSTWFIYCIKDVKRSKRKISVLSSLLRIGFQAKFLYLFLKRNNLINKTLHYTYWFNEQSTLLSVLTSQSKIGGYISRAHGFDLYGERHREGFIPFREFQLMHVSKLFLISKNGLKYMEEKYPQHNHIYALSYLGIENNYPIQFKNRNTGKYIIVSCSRVVDIKRVNLIVESLSLITTLPIKWIHFGDGPLLINIKNMTRQMLPLNVEAEFKGHVANRNIYEYYKNNHVDCFINLSSTEGLPVTIMEAISYGIPVIATDVGGTAEIVTEEVGLLLKKNCTPADIAATIERMLVNVSKDKEFRKNIYDFWDKNFNASINYSQFSKQINEIPL